MPERGKGFRQQGKAIWFGPVAVKDESLTAAAGNLVEVIGEQKEESDPSKHEARRSSGQ